MQPFTSDESWLFGYRISGVGGIATNSPVTVGPLAKMNFLVGRNNHGKSTVMRAAQQWTIARSGGSAPGSRATLVPVAEAELRKMLRACSVQDQSEVARRLAVFVPLGRDGQVGIWVQRSAESNTHGAFDGRGVSAAVKDVLGIPNYSVTYRADVSPHVAAKCVLIPAFRQLRTAPEGTKTPEIASGEGLVAELSTWERPSNPGTGSYLAAKARWMKLRAFVRDVLEDPDAELEIAQATDLHVHLAQAGGMLHVDNLGDGIKQVIMIAAACIAFDDHLVLLEEPEIHLHAGLQRKLMRFLSTETRSQYLIATHSAHVLDLPGAAIFHVTHDGTTTRVAPAIRASDVQQVCLDLGYMASDLLQSNFTVWVEGPSDRVYWSRWLKLIDSDLIEGVHFSVMSYGGYLIDGVHLRDEPDPATEDLIQLLRLGRQCVVIADSDKSAPDQELRPTLLRLLDESAQPGSGQVIVCDWVRTVEGLIPRDIFRTSVIRLHPRSGKLLKTPSSFDAFDDPFAGMRKGSYSKVAIAKNVAASIELTDMDEQLRHVASDLAAAIRRANGLPASSASWEL